MSIDESVIQEIDKQAFPFAVVLRPEQHTIIAHGMSLRDYFAAQVLMGWFAGFEAGQPYRDVDEEANARLAYRQADAMLAERAK